jgi:hypothetical protein
LSVGAKAHDHLTESEPAASIQMLPSQRFWLPEHDGTRIAATLARGIVTLRVPRR